MQVCQKISYCKENAYLRQELKEAMDELKVLREKDRKATRQIAGLEKEEDELKEDLASAGAHIGPEAKSYQRLLADFRKQ